MTAPDILLVEDNVQDAELAMRTLLKNNVIQRIIHLQDGADALNFLFGNGQYQSRDVTIKPRLILLDLKMPKVSGLEVLEKIKSSVSTKSIPVVVFTSSREPRDVEKSYLLGANSYIVKPVDFENYRKIINELGMYWLMSNQVPA